MPAILGRLARRVESAGDADGGFTVLEAVVSFTLFVTVAASAINGVVNSLQASHISQRRVDAANIAQAFITSAQANTATVTVESGREYSANVLTETFEVKRWITFSNLGGTQCSPGATFTVSVTVADSDGHYLARSDSVVTC